ncbi:MAG: hypothetical protein ACIAQ0_01390 [Phycisphaerales bacterium JB058]
MGFDKRTLLVLGAGASTPYGLPTGAELTEQVAHTITRMSKFQSGVQIDKKLSNEYYTRQKDKLASTIRLSRSPTIDTFLRHSSHNRSMVASGIANVIWKKEDDYLSNIDREAHPDTRPLSHFEQDDWIAWLYHNRLFSKPSEFHKNQLAVISYNYDRLPVALLATMMSNSYQEPLSDCIDTICQPIPEIGDRFLHPHGKIPFDLIPIEQNSTKGSLASSGYKNALDDDSFQSILTMYDEYMIESVQPEIDKRIDWAEQIFFMGIGYHDEILSRYHPDKFAAIDHFKSTEKQVFGTAYRLDAYTRKTVENKFMDHVTKRSRITLGAEDERCIQLLINHLE